MYILTDFVLFQDITLVVSDKSPSYSQSMLSSLGTSNHPFAKAIVVTPDGGDVPLITPANIPVLFQSRHERPETADICTVDVKTTWFVMSTSMMYLKDDVQIMASSDNKAYKPLVSYEEATLDSCYAHPTCLRDLQIAREITPAYFMVYDDFDFVFHTDSRNEYCQFVNDTGNSTWSDFPSAMSYTAYLQRTGIFDQLYATSDRRMFGSQVMFETSDLSSLAADSFTATLQARNLNALSHCVFDKGVYKCPKKRKGKGKRPRPVNQGKGRVRSPRPGNQSKGGLQMQMTSSNSNRRKRKRAKVRRAI